MCCSEMCETSKFVKIILLNFLLNYRRDNLKNIILEDTYFINQIYIKLQ